jgi:hypothetical protein
MPESYSEQIRQARWKILREMLITFGTGWAVAVLLLMNHETVFRTVSFHRTGEYVIMFIIVSYCISGIIAGWKTLSRITPAVFLFLPLLGWVIYFVSKFVLAFCVGLVMLPVRTIYSIIKLYGLRK